MSELEESELYAEIARLRALCERHDIDPDEPEPKPYVETYGPPTESDWRIRRLFQSCQDSLVKSLTERNALAEYLSGDKWPETIRVRLPDNFTVR